MKKLNVKQLTKNRVLLAGVSVALAAGISFVLIPQYEKSSREAVQVVSIESDVAQGQKIPAESLKVLEIPKEFLPADILQNEAQAAGRYAAVDLKKGDWLTSRKVSEETGLQTWYEKIDRGRCAVSVTIKTLASGVSGQLQPGDIISFVSANTDSDSVILPELQYLEVIQISTASGADYDANVESEEQEPAATVTVLADSVQATLLADQELNSNLHAVLVCRGNPDKAQELLKLQEEILENPVSQETAQPQYTEEEEMLDG